MRVELLHVAVEGAQHAEGVGDEPELLRHLFGLLVGHLGVRD